MFLVPRHSGGLQPILNLKQFNHYMHICTFKMPSNRYGNLFNDYGCSINFKKAYLHIPIVKHHCNFFFRFVWQNKPYQWKVLPFGLATAPRVLTSL